MDWTRIKLCRSCGAGCPGDAEACHRCQASDFGPAKEPAPWIFAPIEHDYPDDLDVALPTFRERLELLMDHYRLMLNDFPVKTAVWRMRKHIGWYTAGMYGSANLRARIMIEDDADKAMEMIRDFGDGFTPQ